ncbi:MAG: YbaB/EbfC family nucleoid-associated protein [Egibacteraceae bacterium]
MGNMNQMMRQAQAMQRKLEQAQAEVAEEEITGQAGGGMVAVTVNGTGTTVKHISIDPEAVDPDDPEMLADIVTAAVNDALRAAKAFEEEQLGGIAGQMGLPPGML